MYEEALDELLMPDFDIQKHIGSILKNGDYAEQIEKLSITINSLDKKLHNQISSNYDKLLSQTFVVKEMETKFVKVKERINCLQELSTRLKAKIYGPFQAIESLTTQLSNLQVTCDALRHYSRFSTLTCKLKEQMAGDSKEIAKAAFTIKEIETLLAKNGNLTAITDVKGEISQMQTFKQVIRTKARDLLLSSISNKNLVQTGTALQVFNYYGQLGTAIDALLDSCYCFSFRNSLVACLDMVEAKNNDDKTLSAEHQAKILDSTLDPGGETSLGAEESQVGQGQPAQEKSVYKGSASLDLNKAKKGSKQAGESGIVTKSQGELKGAFWSAWDKFLWDTVYDIITSVAHLQLAVTKKKDTLQIENQFAPNPESNTKLDKNVYDSIFENFVNRLESILAEEVNARHGSQKKQYILLKQICEGEYPRLLRSLQDLKMRLHNSNTISQLSSHLGTLAESENEMIDMKTLLDSYILAAPVASDKIPHSLTKLDSLFRESIVNAFQKGYLSKSLSRLFDPVNVLFSSSTSSGCAPTLEDMSSFVKVMTNELAVVKFDTPLMCLVGKNITKTIKLLLVKCEQMLDNSSIAYKITTQPNSQQVNNASIASILYDLGGVCTDKIFKSFEEINVDQLDRSQRDSLLALKQDYNQLIRVELPTLLKVSCLNPFFSALEKTLEDIVITMHQENFDDPDFAPVVSGESDPSTEDNGTPDGPKLPLVLLPASPYMKEFLDFVKGFKRNVLNPLYGHNFDFNQSCLNDASSAKNYADILGEFKVQVLAPTVRNFVFNVTLLRPINDSGRQKLASDAAHFESALTSILLPGHEIETYALTTNEASNVADPYSCLCFKRFTQNFVLHTELVPDPLAYFERHEIASDGKSILTPLELAVILHSFTYFDEDNGGSLLPSPQNKLGLRKDECWRTWLKPRIIRLCDTQGVEQAHQSTVEIVQLIKSCFDEYASGVFQSQLNTFHQAYPIIMKIIEKYQLSF